MNILFDLDGTLIDSSERMYRLFSELVPESGLTKEEYWQLKRNKISHRILFEMFFPKRDFAAFEKEWLNFIESDKYLCMDQLYPDTIEILRYLNQEHALYLVTSRQLRQELMEEMKRLGILSYFLDVLVTEGKENKEQLLQRYAQMHPFFHKPSNVLVSDMGKDVYVGKTLGYRTIAITHGFMDRKILAGYMPECIIDKLSELKGIIGGVNYHEKSIDSRGV